MCKKTNDLADLLENYENNLCNKIFRYQLNQKIDIDIVFYLENFCHLLGIQHVYGKDKKYLGAKGYNKVKNKELCRKDLKSHNKKESYFGMPDVCQRQLFLHRKGLHTNYLMQQPLH